MNRTFEEIKTWLAEENSLQLKQLWNQADVVRQKEVGNTVHLRGLIELSNYCRRNCLYCGIRAAHQSVERYRMSISEVLESAKLAEKFGYGSLVIQAGEDLFWTESVIADLIREIKHRHSLAITLSLGERTLDECKRWKDAGADRYLLRFETSNPQLFRLIHPKVPGIDWVDRCERLLELRKIGYEIGSGVMIGIPGQSIDDLAKDICLFAELELDMIGCGPFLAHPETPLGRLTRRFSIVNSNRSNTLLKTECLSDINNSSVSNQTTDFIHLHNSNNQKDLIDFNDLHFSEKPTDFPAFFYDAEKYPDDRITTEFAIKIPKDQVSSSNEMAFKVIALTRLVCPKANIPSTTAIATLDGKSGRINGLSRGANVIMPNLTPQKYRQLYEIYPSKAASLETAEQTHQKALEQISEIGRVPAVGAGTSLAFLNRRNA